MTRPLVLTLVLMTFMIRRSFTVSVKKWRRLNCKCDLWMDSRVDSHLEIYGTAFPSTEEDHQKLIDRESESYDNNFSDESSASTANSLDSARQLQMARYLRRIKRRNEMPLSQSWYKFRQKHISKNQKRAYASLWPLYGIDLTFNTTIRLADMFGFNSTADVDPYVVLEIGFGSGESLVRIAADNPLKCYVGCEIHRASIANTLMLINQSSVTNIRLVRCDATVLLESHLERDSIDEVSIFFPDPWRNSGRDSERRVIRRYLLGLYSLALKNRGKLNVATDVEEYATHVRRTTEDFDLRSEPAQVDTRSPTVPQSEWRAIRIYNHAPGADLPDYRCATKYETKAAAEARSVWELRYELVK